MNLLNLFPTPVAFFRIGRDLTEKERAFVLGQDTYMNQGNTTSCDREILNNQELSDIKAFIDDSVAEYFSTVHCPSEDVSLYMTQSWANYTCKGQFHHKHAHPNSVISGVFYPQANREVDKIYFFKDRYERIKMSPTKWNAWNSESWWYEVGSGDLIIFPSDLTHMVDVKEDENVRVSIAFNTFVTGLIGNEDTLTKLKLGRM